MKQRFLKISNLSSIVVISLIATAIVLSFSLFQNKRESSETIKQAKNDLSRLTEVASSNIEIGLISVDQTLRRAAERQYFNLLFGKQLNLDMQHNLKMWVTEVPHISAMMITNQRSSIEVAFKRDEYLSIEGIELHNVIKTHFNVQKELASDTLYITQFEGLEPNQLVASRRLQNLQGELDGLVVAIIDSKQLINLLKPTLSEKNIEVAILQNSGSLLMSSSSDLKIFESVVSNFDLNDKSTNQIHEQNTDTKLRLFSHQSLGTLPVSVILTIDDSEIFAYMNAVQNQYYMFAIIFVAFIGSIISFAYLFDKQIKKSRSAENKAILASQAKSDFLAKMSHELRTPLNAIIGFSEMISKEYFGKLSPEQSERILDIHACGNHLLELINDVLDFSKGSAGKLTLKEEIVDIGKIVNTSIRIIEQRARNNGISVINAVPEEDNLVFADRKKLKQIIINLLSNSIKFTPEGGKIIISSHYDKEKNFVISVSDTGRGIDKKDIPKAMAVFEQVHGEDVDEGTGLGLPLCKMLAEMHNGNFKLSSKVGVGTTAYVTLPNNRLRPRVKTELQKTKQNVSKTAFAEVN